MEEVIQTNRTDKLHDKYLKKLVNGKQFTVEDLYEFSTIKLKKKRNRKKFNKYPHRYVPLDVSLAYTGIMLSQSITKIATAFTDMPEIKPINGPVPELKYFDYQYDYDFNSE